MPLTSRKNPVKSRTGHRKGPKQLPKVGPKPVLDLDENDSTSYITYDNSDTPKPRPRARPLKLKSATLQNASNCDLNEAETEVAAMALMALQQQPPKADVDHVDGITVYGSEADEIGSSVAEEIDGLDASDLDSSSECEFTNILSFKFQVHICYYILVLGIPSESPTRLRVHSGCSTTTTPFGIPIEIVGEYGGP